jgi:hypothetical protein
MLFLKMWIGGIISKPSATYVQRILVRSKKPTAKIKKTNGGSF